MVIIYPDGSRPWCWHGAGAEVDRIPPLGRLTSELVFWEIINFFINNAILWISFIMFYGVGSGRRVTWHQIHHEVKGRTWI